MRKIQISWCVAIGIGSLGLGWFLGLKQREATFREQLALSFSASLGESSTIHELIRIGDTNLALETLGVSLALGLLSVQDLTDAGITRAWLEKHKGYSAALAHWRRGFVTVDDEDLKRSVDDLIRGAPDIDGR